MKLVVLFPVLLAGSQVAGGPENILRGSFVQKFICTTNSCPAETKRTRQLNVKQGKARRGKARRGEGEARLGEARRGEAGRGKARQGKARHSKARRGKPSRVKTRQDRAQQETDLSTIRRRHRHTYRSSALKAQGRARRTFGDQVLSHQGMWCVLYDKF